MAQADPLVHGEGSVYLLRPTSRRGGRWIEEHVSEHRLEWAGAIVVEHRFIGDIVREAIADGLAVAVMSLLDDLRQRLTSLVSGIGDRRRYRGERRPPAVPGVLVDLAGRRAPLRRLQLPEAIDVDGD